MHGHISIDRLWWYDLTGVLDICLSISIRIRIFRWGKDSKEKLTWILWTKHMIPSTIEMYNRILCYSYTFLSWIIISPSSSSPLVSVFFKHNITKYLKMSIELWTWNRGDCQGIAIKELMVSKTVTVTKSSNISDFYQNRNEFWIWNRVDYIGITLKELMLKQILAKRMWFQLSDTFMWNMNDMINCLHLKPVLFWK